MGITTPSTARKTTGRVFGGGLYMAVEFRESKSAFVMFVIGSEEMWYPLNHFVSVFGNIHDSFGWKHLNCTTL